MLINGYPEGSDITILNSTYMYPKKIEKGKYTNGFVDIVYRDNVTGQKKIEHIDNPDYIFYRAIEDQDHWNLYLRQDQVEEYMVPAKDLLKHVAELTGKIDFFYDNIKSGNRGANRALHLDYNILGSDFDIEDHFRFRFAKEYTNNIYELSKGYFDIEVDTIDLDKDFPDSGECPVNAISFIVHDKNKAFSLLLRNKNNPQIAEAEKLAASGELAKMVQAAITKQIGGWKKVVRNNIDHLDIKFYFYNDEIALINDFFKLVHHFEPDFLLAWNCSFDMPYLHDRIEVLGYDPLSIICDPSIPYEERYYRYYIDEENKNEFEERGDYAKIAMKTVVLDQMIHFASRRKGQAKFISYSLDAIGQEVAKIRKYGYTDITTDLSKLPYLDYITFLTYNMIDTVCQVCIENATGDIDYIFSKCLVNNTRYHKGHRQTVYLRNRGNYEFYKSGYVMGNNNSAFNEKPKEKYAGAFVGDPQSITDYSKMVVNGVPLYIFNNLDDFDFARLYPSCVMQDNMAPNTQIGMLQIEDDSGRVHKIDKYPTPMAFAEDLQSRNFTIIGNRWFGLANYKELVHDIKDYFENVKDSSRGFRRVDEEGLRIPVHFKKNKDEERKVIYFRDKNKEREAVFFSKKLPDNHREIIEELERRVPDVKSMFRCAVSGEDDSESKDD